MQLRPLNHKKKGALSVGDIGPIALAVGIAIIIVAVVAMILAQMNTNITDENATEVLNLGIAAIMDFADWFAIIVIVVVAVIIIGLVMLLRGAGGGGT